MPILKQQTAKLLNEKLRKTELDVPVRRWPRMAGDASYMMVRIAGTRDMANNPRQELIYNNAQKSNATGRSRYSYAHKQSAGNGYDQDRDELLCVIWSPFGNGRQGKLGNDSGCDDDTIANALRLDVKLDPCYVDFMHGVAHIGEVVGAWNIGGKIFLAHAQQIVHGRDVSVGKSNDSERTFETSCRAQEKYYTCQPVASGDKVYIGWAPDRLHLLSVCCIGS